MADVTAAVDTFSDTAICGSEGSRMLVASVPVAASAASTAICSTVERASVRGLASIARVWSAMVLLPSLDDMYHINRGRKAPHGFILSHWNKTYVSAAIAREVKQSRA